MCKTELWAEYGCLWLLYANRVWGRPVTWPKFYRPKMDKTLMNLNRWISVISDINEKWFVIFEYTFNHAPFFWLCLCTLTWTSIFFVLLFFSYFFSFFYFFPSYLLANSQAIFKFEQLEITEKTSVGLKSGLPNWGHLPHLDPSKVWIVKLLLLDGSNFQKE